MSRLYRCICCYAAASAAALTLLRAFLPTDFDKVALSALLARYSTPPPTAPPAQNPHLRGLIQQQPQNQADPPAVRARRCDRAAPERAQGLSHSCSPSVLCSVFYVMQTQLTAAARRQHILGRVLVAAFPLADSDGDGQLTAEEAASVMIRSSRVIADVFHTAADMFLEVDAKPLLQAALAVVWPPSLSSNGNAMSLPELARVANMIMSAWRGEQAPQQGVQHQP